MPATITGLFIYPVKSLGGISLGRTALTPEGLEHDRRWMLTDRNGRFISQREVPGLALLRVEPATGGFRIAHAQQPEWHTLLPAGLTGEERVAISVWDDHFEARAVSHELDEWFSDMLHYPCRLVRMGPESVRPVDARYAENLECTGFADGFPVLLLSRASLDDLNARLAEPVPMNRFRPNMVVNGTLPFAEDTWKTFRAGDALLRCVKPCGRCVMTTINQDTAMAAAEPLRTLATYRSRDNNVLFGQNVLVLQPGELRCGDEIRMV